MAKDMVGTLYDYYMAIDAAPTKSEHRDKYVYIVSAAKGDAGARKLAADFILRLFKHFPDDLEVSVQALATLSSDPDASIRKSAQETLVEVCRTNTSYIRRVADLFVQIHGLAESTDQKTLQQCLVKLMKIEPKMTLEGILDQISTAEDVIRRPAIKFLRAKLSELPPSANNSDIANLLIGEYKKVLPELDAEEFENLIASLSSMKFFQTLAGSQMLVELLETNVIGTPYALLLPAQVERLVASCKLALPSFSKMVQSNNFVEYFCDHVVPSISAEDSDADVPVLQAFAELCTHTGDLKRYKDDIRAIINKLNEILTAPPADAVVDASQLPNLHLAPVEALLAALHHLGKKHPQYFAESDPAGLESLRQRLKFLSSCIQLYLPTLQAAKGADAETQRKVEATRAIASNIRTLMLDFFHNPPTFKSTVHYSWKKGGATGATSAEPQRNDGKISTKRKSDDPGITSSKIRTIPTTNSNGRGGGSARGARGGATTRGRGGGRTGGITSVPVDQTVLDARAKRFGMTSTSVSNATEGTARFAKTKRI